VENLPDIEPLLLEGDSTDLVRGNKAGNIVLSANHVIRLECPGSTISAIQKSVAHATCMGGDTLSVDHAMFKVKELGCETWPERLSWTAGTCMGERTLVKLGYETSQGKVELIEACHDTARHNTLYVKYVLRQEAVAARKKFQRPSWLKAPLFE
jgi:hypothetical protein